MPDSTTLLAFFAGCAVVALCFGIADYRQCRRDRRMTSSLPPMPPHHEIEDAFVTEIRSRIQ